MNIEYARSFFGVDLESDALYFCRGRDRCSSDAKLEELASPVWKTGVSRHKHPYFMTP